MNEIFLDEAPELTVADKTPVSMSYVVLVIVIVVITAILIGIVHKKHKNR